MTLSQLTRKRRQLWQTLRIWTGGSCTDWNLIRFQRKHLDFHGRRMLGFEQKMKENKDTIMGEVANIREYGKTPTMVFER